MKEYRKRVKEYDVLIEAAVGEKKDIQKEVSNWMDTVDYADANGEIKRLETVRQRQFQIIKDLEEVI